MTAGFKPYFWEIRNSSAWESGKWLRPELPDSSEEIKKKDDFQYVDSTINKAYPSKIGIFAVSSVAQCGFNKARARVNEGGILADYLEGKNWIPNGFCASQRNATRHPSCLTILMASSHNVLIWNCRVLYPLLAFFFLSYSSRAHASWGVYFSSLPLSVHWVC